MTDMLEQLMTVWDRLPAAEAVARAWMEPSPAHGTWHRHARRDVADLMPLLARALDRLLAELEEKLPAPDPALWEELPRLARVACRDVSCRCGHLHVRHARRGALPGPGLPLLGVLLLLRRSTRLRVVAGNYGDRHVYRAGRMRRCAQSRGRALLVSGASAARRPRAQQRQRRGDLGRRRRGGGIRRGMGARRPRGRAVTLRG